MDLSRRDLLRSTGAIGGAIALGGLADHAVAGVAGDHTTLNSVLVKGKADPTTGWRPVVRAPGEPHLVRTDLGALADAGRAEVREALLAFVQLSDVHVLDAQSPLRFEAFDASISSSAYRPQEVLTAQVAEAMVRKINRIANGPVTGLPLAFALQTGDNSDNSQYNEIRWNIDVLDGGTITPDSGDLTRYEGVMDRNRDFYDPYYWHPHGTPQGLTKDAPRRKYGFPKLPGLLDQCRQPFQATGLNIPWYVALGNHDELVQGNFKLNASYADRAVGTSKPYKDAVRTVSADPDRRLLTRAETVAEHFTTTGLPVGHGFTQENLDGGTAYYVFDQGDIRFVVLDTVTEAGDDNGSMDATQFAWLQATLAASSDKIVIVSSHHTSWTMDSPLVADDGKLGQDVVAELLLHENVIAWVNGHTHRNVIKAHLRDGGGGFWEINTAAHIDWPQQSRLIEVTDNTDGTLSIFCTMLDHGAPLAPKEIDTTMKLAGWSRLLAANDWQERDDNRRGKRSARNVELLVTAPGFPG